MKAIEIAGHVDERHVLHLDEPLDLAGPRRSRLARRPGPRQDRTPGGVSAGACAHPQGGVGVTVGVGVAHVRVGRRPTVCCAMNSASTMSTP